MSFPLTFRLYRAHTSSELTSLKEYINHSAKSILSAQQDFEREYAQETKGEVNPSEQDYWDHEYYKVIEIFPSFYRQSTFIGLYSFLEERLNSLCDQLRRFKKYKIKLSDLSGENIIEKSKKYLRLVVDLEIEGLDTLWLKITEYQKIRNCFVHLNSSIIRDKELPLEKQKLYPIVKANPDLELKPGGIIDIVNDNFLLQFILTIRSYISSLLDKIEDQVAFD